MVSLKPIAIPLFSNSDKDKEFSFNCRQRREALINTDTRRFKIQTSDMGAPPGRASPQRRRARRDGCFRRLNVYELFPLFPNISPASVATNQVRNTNHVQTWALCAWCAPQKLRRILQLLFISEVNWQIFNTGRFECPGSVVCTPSKGNFPQSKEKFQRHAAGEKKDSQIRRIIHLWEMEPPSLRSVEGFSPYGKYSSSTGSRKLILQVLIWFCDLAEQRKM